MSLVHTAAVYFTNSKGIQEGESSQIFSPSLYIHVIHVTEVTTKEKNALQTEVR